MGSSHLMPFWLYSNGEFIQAGISYWCPAIFALLKKTQTPFDGGYSNPETSPVSQHLRSLSFPSFLLMRLLL